MTSRPSPWCPTCGALACGEHTYPCEVCGIDDGNFLIPTGETSPDGVPVEMMLCRRHLPEEEKFAILRESTEKRSVGADLRP